MSSGPTFKQTVKAAWYVSDGSLWYFLIFFPPMLIAGKFFPVELLGVKLAPVAVLMYRDEASMREYVWCSFPDTAAARDARDALQEVYEGQRRFYLKGERPTILIAIDDPGDWQVVNDGGDLIANKVSREAAYELLRQMQGQHLVARPCWQGEAYE